MGFSLPAPYAWGIRGGSDEPPTQVRGGHARTLHTAQFVQWSSDAECGLAQTHVSVHLLSWERKSKRKNKWRAMIVLLINSQSE